MYAGDYIIPRESFRVDNDNTANNNNKLGRSRNTLPFIRTTSPNGLLLRSIERICSELP